MEPKIVVLHIPVKMKINPGAFRGVLRCPHPTKDGVCGGTSWKFVEMVTPVRIRYQCRKCGRTIQYDFSNNEDFLRNHPYGPFKKSIFQQVIEKWKKSKPQTIK